MTSLLLGALGSQTPRVSLVPSAAGSEAAGAVFLASSYGLTPDVWQADVLAGWLGVTADGRWASTRCGLSVPRQNGKNAILEMRELFGMVVLGERFLHTAHEVKTARKAFIRLASFFEDRRFPELRALLDGDPRRTNGQEAIYLSNGGSVEFVARSKGSARGFSVDVLVMDEAQELGDEALEALVPTTSVSPNPQRIWTGTPPTKKTNGEVFTRVRNDGLGGSAERLCWHEWGCDGEDVDLDDRANWARANPALGDRLSVETILDERSDLSDEGFAQERLGMWASSGVSRVIDARVWADLVDVNSVSTSSAFGVEVSPDRQCASIGVCGWREDGRRHIEHVEGHRVGDSVPFHAILGPNYTFQSVDWVVPVAAAITRAVPGRVFTVEASSPAAALFEPLKRAGVNVVKVSTRDYADACGRLYDEANQGLLAHLDQPTLNVALSVARKKAYGSEGQWTWHRRAADSDITPIAAVTLALLGASKKARTNRAAFF